MRLFLKGLLYLVLGSAVFFIFLLIAEYVRGGENTDVFWIMTAVSIVGCIIVFFLISKFSD